MADLYRFGRRVRLPTTVEIKHELRMMKLTESIAALRKEAEELKAAEVKTREIETISALI